MAGSVVHPVLSAEATTHRPGPGVEDVVEDDALLCVRHVDDSTKCLHRLPRQTLDIAQGIGLCLAVGGARNVWLCPDPSQC
jgi:hypothetical protein